MVQLPEWFETLNRDFRYQLTVIGQFAQAAVASKVFKHQFTKAQGERGFYLNPELFGAPIEKSIAVAHHPIILKLHKQEAPKLKTVTK